ncbi:MAG: hypothetical protein JWO78_891 [Micavibrio sp.]|nr:hypothetical protein [Micavibrio sp.]
MYLKLLFRDRTAPLENAAIARAEAVLTGLPYNSFQIERLGLEAPCESLEFRLHDRKIDYTKNVALCRPFNTEQFDCRLVRPGITLIGYLDEIIDNLSLHYDRRPESLRVTATTYPLNGNFTATFQRSGPVWREDRTQPYGQQGGPL